MGIILYQMVSRQLPFLAMNHSQYIASLQYCELTFPESISNQIQQLISFMLEKDQSKRPTIREVLDHDLIRVQQEEIIYQSTNGDQRLPVIKDQNDSAHSLSTASTQSSDSLLVHQVQQYCFYSTEQTSDNITKPWYNFQQAGLDEFLQMIRDKKQNLLVDIVLNNGLSLVNLNKKANNRSNPIKFMDFEGVTGRYQDQNTKYTDILSSGGVYYGQQLKELRDGYGLLYCVNVDGVHNIYEYNWEGGFPTNGRVTWIKDNKWWIYEGPLDKEYLPNGKGTLKSQDGEFYDGEWLRWNYHGQGKLIYQNGEIYDGEWINHIQHGFGKLTKKNGKILDGQWINNKMFGKFLQFQASGQYIGIVCFEDDKFQYSEEDEEGEGFDFL
ncbi:hypothetical protein FGO68_gene10769 [Halteria grandinella]|uniref:Protein kinase domain-containing protein n=1 Tax=Halteria grandinella TaxID=5974 RepID=A0A8J8NUA8_HALGN|nr:hypothetical protein FGO68_gene10769 [Halteria grandinella]